MFYDVHDNVSVVSASGSFYEFEYDYNDRLKKIIRDGGRRERIDIGDKDTELFPLIEKLDSFVPVLVLPYK